MTIDLWDKEFGYELFQIKAILTAMSRRKEHKVDENGVEWYRYLQDRYEFECKRHVYCGKQVIFSEGEVDAYIPDGVEYYVKDEDNNVIEFKDEVIFSFNVPEWYKNEADALVVIEKLREQGKEIDRK